jgi:hypothetical protein
MSHAVDCNVATLIVNKVYPITKSCVGIASSQYGLRYQLLSILLETPPWFLPPSPLSGLPGCFPPMPNPYGFPSAFRTPGGLVPRSSTAATTATAPSSFASGSGVHGNPRGMPSGHVAAPLDLEAYGCKCHQAIESEWGCLRLLLAVVLA